MNEEKKLKEYLLTAKVIKTASHILGAVSGIEVGLGILDVFQGNMGEACEKIVIGGVGAIVSMNQWTKEKKNIREIKKEIEKLNP